MPASGKRDPARRKSPGGPIAKTFRFIVSGEEAPPERARGAAPAPPPLRGRLTRSVRLGAPRAAGAEVELAAQSGRDIVVLHISGGPALHLRPETAYDLLRAQAPAPAARGEAVEAPARGTLRVPAQLQWRGLRGEHAMRGGLGRVLLERIDILTDAAAGLTADLVVRNVDAQVEEGVYRLRREALAPLKGSGTRPGAIAAAPGGEPLLVLVHGVMSNTSAAFGRLWKEHPQRVAALFDHYGERVYALDHRTLGASPLANALTLAQALPGGARVHLLTHSRGGLVAEALARACAGPVREADLRFFAGDAYAQHRRDLRALHALAARKGLRVERMVRVACPARGTLLASKRLDAYLSVFQWGLELAGVPVLPALVDFLCEVATRRRDPEKIPGLAALLPDSAFVRWLHAAPDPLPGELRVVAGDIEGDSVVSWLKTLVADAYYWTDNDLVVQTRSMYGGGPRASAATFVLDQGGRVSHFSYFGNEATAAAIVEGLVEADPRRFRPIGPESWSGRDAGGLRAPRERAPSPEKPAVFVLPGMMGSNLRVGGKRVWLGPRLLFGLKRLRYSPGATNVQPDGPLALYRDLCDFLAESHEVVEFDFDWRRPIEEEARRLAAAVEEALAARGPGGPPVRILAHSMGGLVARAMEIERPGTWQRMMSRAGARLLLLGTPNAGSWAPMQVLSGDDTLGNLLVALGAPFEDHAARALIAAFPGFLQLQAALDDPRLGLARASTWQRLADEDLAAVLEYNFWHTDALQLQVYRWGVPPQDVLDQAVRLRSALDRQREERLAAYAERIVLVTGRADFTPDGFDASGPQGLEYLHARDGGDGRVTLASARLPGVRAWSIDCDHGELASEQAAFGGYLDLLQSGTTGRLATLAEGTPRAAAGAAAALAHARMRPSRSPSSGRPPGTDAELFIPSGREVRARSRDAQAALRVTVVNGNLKFVRQPLLLGHYRSTRLTGTERVMDRLIGGAMSEKLDAGAYPDAPGASDVFANRRADPDYPGRAPIPEAVIVAGLGEEGKLRAADLVQTVRQAVIAWAQREVERRAGAPASFELAATLVGSGGSGIAPGQSAQLVAQGVREANERLGAVGWPRVGHLSLVELYLERAVDAWRALQAQALAAPGQLEVAEAVEAGVGALLRPLESGYRGADYDLITAIADRGAKDGTIAYTLDTRRARTEIRAQKTQGALLRRLVASASSQWKDDPRIGRTLFRLLVPVEMEPFFGGSTEMLIELDATTAGIPWELLDPELPDAQGQRRPWAIRSKLVRKLRLESFRRAVRDASAEDRVLVIGDPAADRRAFPVLPGARAEAAAVHRRLSAPGALGAERVLLVASDGVRPDPDQSEVLNALMAQDWRIVHVSGHGMPPEEGGEARGVVLSGGTFLGPRELANMRVVPELVFVNCCHLAARDAAQVLAPRFDRARFAAGVAESLVALGVRCVIAAGWAVDDAAAETFATSFYDALLRGRRFMDAAAEARDAAYGMGGNTWAAYQCYGDPDWVFNPEGADAQAPPRPLGEDYATIASAMGLVNALETLEAGARYDERRDAQQARLRYLADRFAARWGRLGIVATAFARAWDALGDRAAAIAWYERALAGEDGSAPLEAVERLADLRVATAWESIERAEASGRAPPARALSQARRGIEAGVALLERLAGTQPSARRWSLLGAASARLALIADALGEDPAPALRRMKACHEEAAEAARRTGSAHAFRPALDLLAADLALARGRTRRLDGPRVARIRAALEEASREDPELLAAAGHIELAMVEAAARGRLAAGLEALAARHEELHARVRAKPFWAAVRERAGFVRRMIVRPAARAEVRAMDELLARLRELG